MLMSIVQKQVPQTHNSFCGPLSSDSPDCYFEYSLTTSCIKYFLKQLWLSFFFLKKKFGLSLNDIYKIIKYGIFTNIFI